MSHTIKMLNNGSTIKLDVVESFNKAVNLAENRVAGDNFWDFVSADMHMDLSTYYAGSYIDECFDVLADEYV